MKNKLMAIGSSLLGLAAALGFTCLPCWVPVIMFFNSIGMVWLLKYGNAIFVIPLLVIGLVLLIKAWRMPRSCSVKPWWRRWK